MSGLFEEFLDLFESEDEINFSSPFMINRFLSLTKKGFYISNIANPYVGRIPNKLLWQILKGFIGKQNAPRIVYPKKTKQEEILLSKICSHFNCNIKHGKQIINLYRSIGEKPELFFGLKKGE